jgi:hypothetical protein
MPCKCGLTYHDDGRCQTIGDYVRLVTDPAYTRPDGRGVNSGPFALLDSEGREIMTGTLRECQVWQMRKGTDCHIVRTVVGK